MNYQVWQTTYQKIIYYDFLSRILPSMTKIRKREILMLYNSSNGKGDRYRYTTQTPNKFQVRVIERNYGIEVTYSLKFTTWLCIGKSSTKAFEANELCNLFCLI